MSVARIGIVGVAAISGTQEACVKAVDCVGSALWVVLERERSENEWEVHVWSRRMHVGRADTRRVVYMIEA
jgi:hypothetical protein